MDKSKKIALGVLAALILFIIGGAIYYVMMTPSGTTMPTGATTPPVIEMPKATGNLDDTAAALLQGANNELTVIGNGDYEGIQLSSDSQEINDFSQSVNENEF